MPLQYLGWSQRKWLVHLIGLSMLLVWLDYLTGPYILFPITFIFPVTLAGWQLGRSWGITFAIVLSLSRFIFIQFWDVPEFAGWVGVMNLFIRIVVLTIFAVMMDIIAVQHRVLRMRVSALEGILPICMFCKKIRSDENTWQPIEAFISERSKAKFSHGFCQDCGRIHYAELHETENDANKATPIPPVKESVQPPLL
ncbi:MAG: hypothetical protein ACRCZF_15205 [Gemmataceae bacterium]